MKKNKIIIGMFILFVSISLLSSVCFAKSDDKVIKWDYVSAWVKANALYKYDEYIADKVYKMTDGNFQIKVHPAGEMVPAYQTFDSVSSGSFQCGSTAPAYQAGLNSAFTLFSTEPLYMSQQDYANWLYQVDGLKMMNGMAEQYNVKYFPNSIFDLEAGWRSNKPLKTAADYKGLKVRTGPRESQEILKRLGASPLAISGGELYDAMEKNILDAFEYETPNIDWDLGFQEIAEYWVAPAWYETSCVYFTMVNLDSWRNLPDNYKVIFEETCKACTLESSSYMNWQSALATKKFMDYGTKISKADESFWEELMPIVKDVFEDFSSKNPDYAKVVKSQVDYLKKYYIWKKLEVPFESGYIVPSNMLPEIKDEWLKK
jgi:TRAP-type mannitol/chloroaromatic compound transport system substrate-binding protein